MTNAEVAELLNTSLSTVRDLGEQLGVIDDEWTVSDALQADGLLEPDEDDEDEDEDE